MKRRFLTLDFGQSEFDYKDFFATDRLCCANVIYLRPSPRNILLIAAHQAVFLLDAAVLKVLRWLRIKDWLKRLIRPPL